ncbi:hypothetical protein F2Q69_00011694 [Brassica cretica]|uniref:Uncharacterized protein n=1 Tax=Brassica cretica TaxID=69181 RepID=A0A8S9R0Z5_BRACR|nr:hypothetical protein F2Q69_00011694 [Brassica cretica]
MDYSSLFSRSIFSQSYHQDPPSPSRSAISVQIRRLSLTQPATKTDYRESRFKAFKMLIPVQDTQLVCL